MKNFEIFLRNGTVAHVTAAKMERKEIVLDSINCPQLAFTNDAGELSAVFTATEVIGVKFVGMEKLMA